MTKNLPQQKDTSLFLDVAAFEHAQRVGKMLTESTMVPVDFRNNIGNCVIALNFAYRTGIDPFMAMQKIYIIHGKPSTETTLLIALFNKSKKWSVLDFKLGGKEDKAYCFAFATDLEAKKVIEGPAVSIEMAKAEGWYDKKGSKWKTLPGLMLRYRAAAFFIRLYAPETSLGLYTVEELIDRGEVIDITPITPAEEIKENANQKIIDIPEPSQEPVIDIPPVKEGEMSEADIEAAKQEELKPDY